MPILVIVFAAVASALLVAEELVKRGPGTRGRVRHPWTLALHGAAGAAVGLASLRDALAGTRPPTPATFAVACVLLAGGTVLRRRAKRDLGESWNVQIAVRDGHQLVDSGVYAYMRHPAYLGLMMQLLAFALGTGSRAALLLAVGCAIPALVLRSSLEDRELTRVIAGYAGYREAKRAYLPFPRRPSATRPVFDHTLDG